MEVRNKLAHKRVNILDGTYVSLIVVYVGER